MNGSDRLRDAVQRTRDGLEEAMRGDFSGYPSEKDFHFLAEAAELAADLWDALRPFIEGGVKTVRPDCDCPHCNGLRALARLAGLRQ